MIRRAVLSLTLLLLAAGCGGSAKKAEPKPAGPFQHFHSRPDLKPPPVTVLTPAAGTDPGFIFIAPKQKVAQAGPMIIDDKGQLVWFQPLGNTIGITDFRVQSYQGRPVLTWWRGKAPKGIGSGNYTILDDSYQLLATVQAGNGLVGDVHEFLITARDTALLTVYHRMDQDLTAFGGKGDGEIFEGVVQEVDLATGNVLFEWHSFPTVGLNESFLPVPKKGKKRIPPWDYFHLNSVGEDSDGNLIISARHTHAVYKISRSTGEIMWRLGGKKSDFRLGPGVKFAWQHDARRQPDGTLTIFDNEAAPKVGDQSRVIVLRLDEQAKTATLVRSYTHPGKPLVSATQGNAQFLPEGHVLVGWGANPFVTEFDGKGHVVLDLRFGKGADSYRAYRLPWVGRPSEPPAVALAAGKLYVSWNGATDVAKWQLLSGPDPGRLAPGATVPKNGFETGIALQGIGDYVAARALDKDGRTLATSRALKTG